MNKFKRVLSDAELISATFKAEVEGTMGELRAVEQAVLAKLAEQEPIGYLHANSISFLSAKGVTAEQARSDDYNMPLYTHPIPNHIADASKMVPEGWQLVPKEPTEEMIQEADESDEIYSKRSFGEGIHLCQSGYDHYKAMLAAAPKYREE